jgi:hypothetical protein
MLPCRLSPALLVLLAGTARADVLVVDPGGGPGHDLLEAAVAAAQDGDIVLLKAGDYTPQHVLDCALVISRKGITLTADLGLQPVLTSHIRVSDVPAGSTCVLRGLAPQDNLPPCGSYVDEGALEIWDCAGSVWVEDCVLRGASVWYLGTWVASRGADVRHSAQVVFRGCEISGGDGPDESGSGFVTPGGHGARGLQAFASRVAVHGSVLRGGHGGASGAGSTHANGNGGDAVLLEQSEGWFTGCTLAGGDDGDGDAASPGGLAGHALVVWGGTPGSAVAWLRDNELSAGAVVGAAGQPTLPIHLLLPYSQVHLLDAAARSFAAPAPLREGQSSAVQVNGLPGDLVGFLASVTPAWVPLPGRQGVLLADATALLGVELFLLGLIADPSGALSVPFGMPALPPSIPGGIAFLAQGVFLGADGLTLGSATQLVWIDDAY